MLLDFLNEVSEVLVGICLFFWALASNNTLNIVEHFSEVFKTQICPVMSLCFGRLDDIICSYNNPMLQLVRVFGCLFIYKFLQEVFCVYMRGLFALNGLLERLLRFPIIDHLLCRDLVVELFSYNDELTFYIAIIVADTNVNLTGVVVVFVDLLFDFIKASDGILAELNERYGDISPVTRPLEFHNLVN